MDVILCGSLYRFTQFYINSTVTKLRYYIGKRVIFQVYFYGLGQTYPEALHVVNEYKKIEETGSEIYEWHKKILLNERLLSREIIELQIRNRKDSPSGYLNLESSFRSFNFCINHSYCIFILCLFKLGRLQR